MNFKEASIQLEHAGNILISLYKNLDGIKYLAVKKRKKYNEYYLKLGYNNEKLSKDDIDVIINEIEQKLLIKLDIKRMSPIEKVSYDISKIRQKGSPQDFSFLLKTPPIISGQQAITIEGAGLTNGTLGAIIKLKNKKEQFLISNYHVIMGDTGCLGANIISNNHKIGELFWGLYNVYYDVAIAKITCENIKPGTSRYSYGDLKKLDHKTQNVMITGKASGEETGKIYSRNALVKVKKDWFKNQIIVKNLNSQEGDSGSILVHNSTSKTKDVLGIIIGADQNLTVANNLFNLFSNKIPSFVDPMCRVMPEIEFKSFI